MSLILVFQNSPEGFEKNDNNKIGLGTGYLSHSGLRSGEQSKNIKWFNNKIHYKTMILYLNYKNKKTVFSIKKYFQMYANIIW